MGGAAAGAGAGGTGKGSFWPLFDLVVRTPRLEIRLPREDDHRPRWLPDHVRRRSARAMTGRRRATTGAETGSRRARDGLDHCIVGCQVYTDEHGI